MPRYLLRSANILSDLLGWFGGSLVVGAGVLGACALAAFLIMDTEARRPDFLLRGLYFESGLSVITKAAATFPALAALATPGALVRAVVFVCVTGLTLLRPRRIHAGRTLWMAAVAVPVVTLLTDRIVGIPFVLDAGSFSARHRLFLLLGVTALWVTPRLEVDTVVRLAKLVLGLHLLASIVAVVLDAPGASGAYEGRSLIPGIDERISGVFSHANHLGPAAILYLIIEWVRPSRSTWSRVGMPLIALGMLVLSQSKTSWVAAALVGMIILTSRWEPEKAFATVVFSIAVAIPLALVVGVERGDFLEEIPVRDAETLTGRTELWSAGMEEWRRSPLVGRGSGIFLEIAEDTDQDWAKQAHNEYVQTLAEDGLLGLAATVVYVVVLLQVGARHALATRNGSFALVALPLLQTATETHLVSFDLVHLTVLALLFAWEREVESSDSSVGLGVDGVRAAWRPTATSS